MPLTWLAVVATVHPGTFCLARDRSTTRCEKGATTWAKAALVVSACKGRTSVSGKACSLAVCATSCSQLSCSLLNCSHCWPLCQHIAEAAEPLPSGARTAKLAALTGARAGCLLCCLTAAHSYSLLHPETRTGDSLSVRAAS